MKVNYGSTWMSINPDHLDKSEKVQRTEARINELWHRVTGQPLLYKAPSRAAAPSKKS